MRDRPDLSSLLNPGRIAVIGASNSEFKVGGIVLRRLGRSRRRLYPVNPKESVIQGHKVFPDVPSLPDGIDLAVITLSAPLAVRAVEACIEKQIPNCIVVAGGFGETGGQGMVLEERLKTLARQNRVNILGPNSLGIFLPNEEIDTIFVEHGDRALARDGSIACIVQSGSIGTEALGYAANTGFGMRAFVGLGNKCDLDENDFLMHFGRDPKTRCLGFYLENIADGRTFLRNARRVSRQKPVVILKAGMSHTAAAAVASHTGKLAGSDKVISGAFKQFGIQRVFDDEQFCDATKVLSMGETAPGNRVAVLTGAGGYGVMCTDFVEQNLGPVPLTMARLSGQTRDRIRQDSFEFCATDNPVDLTASADDAMFGKALDALIADPGVDLIICIAFFSPPGISEALIDIIVEKGQNTPKPILVFTKYGPFTDNRIKDFFHAGVAAFPSVERTVRAARFLVERSQICDRIAGAAPDSAGALSKPAGHDLPDGLGPGSRPDEFEVKGLLRTLGIQVPPGLRLDPGQTLLPDDLARQGIQSPWAVKVCSADIRHKTEKQGVILNVDPDRLEKALAHIHQTFPGSPVLVEHQLAFCGPEFIIGLVQDPVLGHSVMVGAGGTLTEIYRDAAFRLAPCSAADAAGMISELILAPVFEGFRGMTLDKAALARIISRVSGLVAHAGTGISQLDINPIVWHDSQWWALDGMLLFQDSR